MTAAVVAEPSPTMDLPPAPGPGYERLRSSREVSATLRSGRRRAGRVSVVHATDHDLPVTRLTVVASKKVGSAVRRNRAKRLLREAARRAAWSPGHDVVLVARADTATAHARDVAAEVRELARRLDLVGHDADTGTLDLVPPDAGPSDGTASDAASPEAVASESGA